MDDHKEINDLKILFRIAINKEKQFNDATDFNNLSLSNDILDNINNDIKLKNKIREEIDIRYQFHLFYNFKKITNNTNFINDYRSNKEKLLKLLRQAINILNSLLNYVNLNKGKINTSEEQTKKSLDINLELDYEIIKIFSDDNIKLENNKVIKSVFNGNYTEYI